MYIYIYMYTYMIHSITLPHPHLRPNSTPRLWIGLLAPPQVTLDDVVQVAAGPGRMSVDPNGELRVLGT